LAATFAMATFTPPPPPSAPKRHIHDHLPDGVTFAILSPQDHLRTSHPPPALTPMSPSSGSRQCDGEKLSKNRKQKVKESQKRKVKEKPKTKS